MSCTFFVGFSHVLCLKKLTANIMSHLRIYIKVSTTLSEKNSITYKCHANFRRCGINNGFSSFEKHKHIINTEEKIPFNSILMGKGRLP